MTIDLCTIMIVDLFFAMFNRYECNFIFSDSTLNPNGVRFGSAEIYHIGKLLLLLYGFTFILKVKCVIITNRDLFVFINLMQY